MFRRVFASEQTKEDWESAVSGRARGERVVDSPEKIFEADEDEDEDRGERVR